MRPSKSAGLASISCFQFSLIAALASVTCKGVIAGKHGEFNAAIGNTASLRRPTGLVVLQFESGGHNRSNVMTTGQWSEAFGRSQPVRG